MGLFEGQVSRKPDHYPEAQKFIDSIWNGFWTPNEFNFRQDITDFKAKLTEEERGVVVRALSAIGQIEIAVKTFWSKLGTNLPHPSITDLGFVMANSEVIHNLAYEKLLIVLGLEEVFEQNDLFYQNTRDFYNWEYDKKEYANKLDEKTYLEEFCKEKQKQNNEIKEEIENQYKIYQEKSKRS
jgi:ribonucleoside-diphosphate reductase beta chain